MSPKAALAVTAALLAGCAVTQPNESNLAAYCTAENAFQIGSQARAYLGVCPKQSEAAFLNGLRRGRALVPPTPQAQPYLAQMTELESQLLSSASEGERESIRARLRDAEWWAVHLINSPGSYGVDGS